MANLVIFLGGGTILALICFGCGWILRGLHDHLKAEEAEDRKVATMSDPDRDPEVALRYRCPFCDAERGKPCVSDLGGTMELPHYSRTPEALSGSSGP